MKKLQYKVIHKQTKEQKGKYFDSLSQAREFLVTKLIPKNYMCVSEIVTIDNEKLYEGNIISNKLKTLNESILDVSELFKNNKYLKEDITQCNKILNDITIMIYKLNDISLKKDKEEIQ